MKKSRRIRFVLTSINRMLELPNGFVKNRSSAASVAAKRRIFFAPASDPADPDRFARVPLSLAGHSVSDTGLSRNDQV
jgi:hypothetical protein